jgi:hypothetical protein
MTRPLGREYEPPTGDAPLDARERAIVRALVIIIANTLLAETIDEPNHERSVGDQQP